MTTSIAVARKNKPDGKTFVVLSTDAVTKRQFNLLSNPNFVVQLKKTSTRLLLLSTETMIIKHI